MEPIPPELFLDAFPGPIQAIGHRLRQLVREAVPDAAERVRPGWHLIGYDAPRHEAEGRGRSAYFAYIAPERHHIHLGFEHGYLMRDPDRRLEGEGITRQVRWLSFEPGDDPDARDRRSRSCERPAGSRCSAGRSASRPRCSPGRIRRFADGAEPARHMKTGATRRAAPVREPETSCRHTSMRPIRYRPNPTTAAVTTANATGVTQPTGIPVASPANQGRIEVGRSARDVDGAGSRRGPAAGRTPRTRPRSTAGLARDDRAGREPDRREERHEGDHPGREPDDQPRPAARRTGRRPRATVDRERQHDGRDARASPSTRSTSPARSRSRDTGLEATQASVPASRSATMQAADREDRGDDEDLRRRPRPAGCRAAPARPGAGASAPSGRRGDDPAGDPAVGRGEGHERGGHRERRPRRAGRGSIR